MVNVELQDPAGKPYRNRWTFTRIIYT
jgi:hypothetical protein